MTTPAEQDHQVIPFPGPRQARGERENLAAYSGPPETAAEYRERMIVNVAVFLVVLGLIGTALWLADTIADMRRNQDCVLSGRPGCTHVDVQPVRRW
jgi:hypothetical protein